jgi:hypothetical protein
MAGLYIAVEAKLREGWIVGRHVPAPRRPGWRVRGRRERSPRVITTHSRGSAPPIR